MPLKQGSSTCQIRALRSNHPQEKSHEKDQADTLYLRIVKAWAPMDKKRESNFKDVQLGLVISTSCQPRLACYEPHTKIGHPGVRDQDTSLQYKRKSRDR